MYKHLHTRIFYISALLIILYLDWTIDLPWYSYLLLYFAYLLTAFWGTYYMELNYFLDTRCNGSRDKKEIAITFDDGPMKEFTPKVLDILKNENVRTSFFVIGKNIRGNEDIIKRMVDEGHVVGNHSFHHGFWFSLQPKARMTEDLKLCDEAIEQVTGKRPRFFRPPYGVTNPWVAKVIKRGDYDCIGWSVRTYDTGNKTKEELMKRALKNLQNGDIILFHDWGNHTIGILSDFIKEVRSRGFEFVRADELLKVKAYF